MTAPTFEDFVPATVTDGDTYKPKENYDKPLLVKVNERKEGIVTEHTPDPGGPGLVVDLVDLSTGTKYQNVLWMGGAIVDNLTSRVGKPTVIRFAETKAKNGRKYPSPVNGSAEDKALAQRYYANIGDPFAPVFEDMKPADTSSSDDPPF